MRFANKTRVGFEKKRKRVSLKIGGVRGGVEGRRDEPDVKVCSTARREWELETYDYSFCVNIIITEG